MRQISLAAFLIAGNCAHSHALWRHPKSRLGGFLTPDYYTDIARSLERGLFDMIFFADRLAMSERFGNNLDVGARLGDQDATRLDPLLVVSLLAGATSRLGLGVTRSTTYHSPYHVARSFATLDHLSRGRAAWNVVTSVNEGEARNHGVEAHPEHDVRYGSADEFMDLTFRLWDTWEPDALVLDRDRGVYADPARIHHVASAGEHYRSSGPLNIPRTPQGRPVIIQAGSSSRGKAFAARWADVTFTVQPNRAAMQRYYRDIRVEAEARGRDPDSVKVLPAVMPFVAKTEAQAREDLEQHNALVDPLVGLSTFSSHLNFDFSTLPLDEPLQTLEVQGMRGMLEAVLSVAGHGGKAPTLREIGRLYGQSVLAPQVAGTPTQVADYLEDLFRSSAADGFMITPAHLPTGFDAFVDLAVPELQRRGLFRHSYAGATLRENLGLARPAWTSPAGQERS